MPLDMCIQHRARPDRHERTDGVKRGSVPEVSFDFLLHRSKRSRDKVSKSSMLVSCSWQPDWSHSGQELMSFSQLLGYSAFTYRSDHEPTTRQTLKIIHSCQRIQLTGWGGLQGLSLKVCSRDLVSRRDQIIRFELGQQNMPVGRWIDFSQSRVQLPMGLSMALQRASSRIWWTSSRFHQKPQQRRSEMAFMFVLGKGWDKTPMCLKMAWGKCSAHASEVQTKIGPSIYPPTKVSMPIHGNIKPTLEAASLPQGGEQRHKQTFPESV